MKIQFKIPQKETITHVFSSDVVTIGRSTKCDITITDESLSRNHCQIERIEDEIYITDLGSTNGVLINREKISSHKKTLIKSFFSVFIGEIELIMSIEEDLPKGSTSTSKKSDFEIRLDHSHHLEKFKKKKPDPKETSTPSKLDKFSERFHKVSSSKRKEKNLIKVIFFFIIFLIIASSRKFFVENFRLTQKTFRLKKSAQNKKTTFYTFDTYRKLYEQRTKGNCGELCKELILYEHIEGSMKNEDSFIIYMNGEKFSKNVEISHIDDKETASELLAIRNVLQSPLIIKLKEQQVSKIHLVCLYGSSYFNKVYLISPENIFKEKRTLKNIIDLINSNLSIDKVENFLQETEQVLPRFIPLQGKSS